jgi:hypothetical protein
MIQASVSIRYENDDSKTHTMNVTIGGSTTTVEFGSSRTATVTIQGGASTCVIETSCGKITIKDGAKVSIKGGCIKVQ